MTTMTKTLLLLVTLCTVVGVIRTARQGDCLDKFDGERNLIGKRYVADGRRLTKNYVTFDKTAVDVRESQMPDYFYRVIRPGDSLTRDFRSGRLNLVLNESNVITRAGCY